MPVELDEDVQAGEGHFRVTLAATCRNPRAAYRWTGEIVGTDDGTITFTVQGAALEDFASPRIGVCMLVGTPALAGQPYEVFDATGKATPGVFPVHVEPELLQPLGSFRLLRYAVDGMTVSAGLVDGAFGMEDQRNYGDSSYKAMSGMAYGYPEIRAGAAARQTFVLQVSGAAAVEDGLARVTVGDALPARMPAIVPSRAAATFANLTACAWNPAKFPSVDPLVLPYSPGLHLFDDDTCMENIPAVVDWARALRATQPNLPIRLDPVTLNPPYPREGDDPRIGMPFAAAWALRMCKYAALAGIGEVAFAFDTRLPAFTGTHLHAVEVSSPWVDALALEDGRLWLMNLTDEEQKVAVGEKVHRLVPYQVLDLLGR
jgi:hypothetical protein